MSWTLAIAKDQPEYPKADGDRFHFKLGDDQRYVSLIRHAGKLHCIDSICFHAGGPLAIGDIEDVEGHTCITCPWHFYKIGVEDGCKYYQPLVKNEEGKMVPGAWKTIGKRQRVHSVEERHDGAYVRPDPDAECHSDHYAHNHEAGERIIHTGLAQNQPHGTVAEDRLPGPPVAAKQGAGTAPWARGAHVQGERPPGSAPLGIPHAPSRGPPPM
ncbi:unnamed protein product [Pedinophyceae sp. YPF-701]|nr:unnamed protein product [Pedinophyceae sp. YPF-701]